MILLAFQCDCKESKFLALCCVKFILPCNLQWNIKFVIKNDEIIWFNKEGFVISEVSKL